MKRYTIQVDQHPPGLDRIKHESRPAYIQVAQVATLEELKKWYHADGQEVAWQDMQVIDNEEHRNLSPEELKQAVD